MSLALLVAVVALALRWLAAVPGRITLAAGRVAVASAAGLVVAATLLPVASGPSSKVIAVAAVLAAALASLLGLLPVGGWSRGGWAAVGASNAAPWPLLLVPVVLLTINRVPALLPPSGATVYAGVLLALGLFSAIWHGVHAAFADPDHRYARVHAADLGLAAAATGSGHLTLALTAGLLLVVTHLALGPLLMQPAGPPEAGPRRLAWALLAGLPPAPAFWGRLVALEAVAQVSPPAVAAAAAVVFLLSLACVNALRRRAKTRPRPVEERATAAAPLWLPAAAAWVPVAAGLAIGLFSRGTLVVLLGGG
jgi:hypothetical protein